MGNFCFTVNILMMKGKGLISTIAGSSPNFIKLFTDVEYLAEMKAKLEEIKRLLRIQYLNSGYHIKNL